MECGTRADLLNACDERHASICVIRLEHGPRHVRILCALLRSRVLGNLSDYYYPSNRSPSLYRIPIIFTVDWLQFLLICCNDIFLTNASHPSVLLFNFILNCLVSLYFIRYTDIYSYIQIFLVLMSKIRKWTGIRSSDLQISTLALYLLSYPGLNM